MSADALRSALCVADGKATAFHLEVLRLSHQLRVVYARYCELHSKVEAQRRTISQYVTTVCCSLLCFCLEHRMCTDGRGCRQGEAMDSTKQNYDAIQKGACT